MPISATCGCGTTVHVPESSGGTVISCPECHENISIPQQIYDAEIVTQELVDAISDPLIATEDERPADSTRRPCPQCGEMIVATAAKCRFCDAVFDSRVVSGLTVKPRSIEDMSAEDKEALKKFRANIQGLGGAGIFATLICWGIAGFQAIGGSPGMTDEARLGLVIVLGFLGLLWAVGAYFCFKMQIWAAYLIGVLSLCGGLSIWTALVIYGVVVVVTKANELKKRRIPLTTRI